ncbi:MAG: hypothetical protein KAY37_00325 [Phycisphaerae bacterium]|nr:hypothetical protein [Phycisphaerae bacterium]
MRYLTNTLRIVVLAVAASALLPNAALGQPTTRASIDSFGVEGNNHSYSASISATGDYVAFDSLANNLVPGDTNGFADVFVRDCLAGQTRLISIDSASIQGNGPSESAAISEDGHYAAFGNWASNLVLGDTNGCGDIFVRDLKYCLGDSNCDGRIDWRDIDFFVAGMNNNVTGWQNMFLPLAPTCPYANNDVNQDGNTNWRDIDPFVALMGTTCP